MNWVYRVLIFQKEAEGEKSRVKKNSNEMEHKQYNKTLNKNKKKFKITKCKKTSIWFLTKHNYVVF